MFDSIPFQLSNEKNLGCLGYIGDYTTQLYRDYFINHYKDPYLIWKVGPCFFRGSVVDCTTLGIQTPEKFGILDPPNTPKAPFTSGGTVDGRNPAPVDG